MRKGGDASYVMDTSSSGPRPGVTFAIGAREEDIDLKKKRKKKKLAKGKLTSEKARKILHDKKVHGKPITEKQRRYFGAVASGSARKGTTMNRESLSKSFLADVKKGYFPSDWENKFWGTPEMRVEALQCIKDQMGIDKEYSDLEAKYPYDSGLSEIQRMKRTSKRDIARKKIRMREKTIDDKRQKLEERLIDHKIDEAKLDAKQSKARKGLPIVKADNNVDVDVDAGIFGIADYGEGGGQMSMRVDPNPKCNICNHYDQNMSACMIGLVPKVCGDGAHPEIGFAPQTTERVAARQWKHDHEHDVVTSSQAPDIGYEAGTVPYRIEVLGDSDLALSMKERRMLLKSALAEQDHDELLDPQENAFLLSKQLGFRVMPPMQEIRKSKMSIDEFADAMGTTEDVVRSIAQRLGDKLAFAKFIKSKLPDIVMMHALTERDVNRLYTAAEKTLKSMSSTEWEAWQGVSFSENVSDEELATAIAQHGLMDQNSLVRGSIIRPAERMSQLPEPEPIVDAQENLPIQPVMDGFVGGNLHLAGELK